MDNNTSVTENALLKFTLEYQDEVKSMVDEIHNDQDSDSERTESEIHDHHSDSDSDSGSNSAVSSYPFPDFTSNGLTAHIEGDSTDRKRRTNEAEIEEPSKRRRLMNNGYLEKWSAADHYGYRCKDIVVEYRCKICKKAFSSSQGLGGHMASHNRVKKNYMSSQCVKNIKPLRAVFDGEIVPVAEFYNNGRHQLYGRATYQCRTCNRIFPTGQALGGHMSHHYTTPTVKQAQIQLNLLNSGVLVHDFDLNEVYVPPTEDEQSYQMPIY